VSSDSREKTEPPVSSKSNPTPSSKRSAFNPLKLVFALEYVLQGLGNPFQGITYQPFFRHFRYDYGLSEAATQNLFSKSYLAWSFKPLLGFVIDAYGRTKTILLTLLSLAVVFYLLTPLMDTSVLMFFGFMFGLSVILAATDVAVDRATVIDGAEEAKSSGKSKATTVGLNQAICWAAIYGTSIIAAVSGGYIADHLNLDYLMYLLALMPLAVLLVVLLLPKDRAVPIPLRNSLRNFWDGLHTGPVMWIMVFYFLFHFQPAMGALWNNYLIEDLHFSQTQIGFSDGASYVGLFLGVLLFASLGIRLQDRLGLKQLFKIFIIISVLINLTQYLLVDPWFSAVTLRLERIFPGTDPETIRLGYLSAYNFTLAIFLGIIRMSTFSLVGAVIPVKAAGSLFAGFMSVSNLAYSFSYASGAWIYEHGLEFSFLRQLQAFLFGRETLTAGHLSISMLILIGSLAYFLSFLAAHMLPDKRQTLAAEEEDTTPETRRYAALDPRLHRTANITALLFLGVLFAAAWRWWGLDPISALLLSFFTVTFFRKLALDRLLHNPGKNT